MTAQPKFYTVADFERFTELPENEHRLFEFINGEIVEKVPTNAHASHIAAEIIYRIRRYMDEYGVEGFVTGADGGYRVGTDRNAPDVAYIPKSKQQALDKQGYNSTPPDLVVEVETNTTNLTERRLRAKVLNYLNNGVVVWVIYPDTNEAEVYTLDGVVHKLGIEDHLDGGDVLPELKIALKELLK